MTISETPHGIIEISLTAIATWRSCCAADPRGRHGVAELPLRHRRQHPRDPNRGIQVHQDDKQVIIDVYVIIEYGRAVSVANSLINAVRYTVGRYRRAGESGQRSRSRAAR